MNELPAGWVVTSLGELLHAIEAGQNVKCEERAPQGNEAGLVKISAVTWGRFDEAASKTLPQDAAVNERNRIRPGDLLISRANTIELVGASVIVGPIEKRLYLSDKVLRLVVDEPAKRWINYALKTPQLRQAIQSASTGNQLSMRNIPQEKLRALSIPLAPAAEQIRIADQLDTLLALIQACNDRLDAIPALLKRFRRSVLDAATSGKLTADWREENGLDAEWERLTLQDIADVVGGVTKDTKKQDLNDEEVPYLRVANVQRGFLDLSEVKTIRVPAAKLEALLLQRGDVLFNEGGDLDKLGRGWIWEEQIPRCTFQNHVFRARLRDSNNQPKFVSWWGNSRGLDYFLRAGKQTTNLASINKTMLSALPIALPSPREQVEIVRRVEALLLLADRFEARHAAAVSHVQRLTPLTLAKAFRGELVRQDSNDEPASVQLQRLAKTPIAAVKAPRGRPQSKQANNPSTAHPDWTSLPTGAWAAGAQIDEHATAALLIAVLKAWGQPTPQDQARLAAMLCLQPRLFTAALPAHDAAPWRRLVGAEAEPLPASVAALQPAVNTHWRRALAGLRARGDLVASGSGPQDTWSLGHGADRVDTAGWPDGRAGWVVAHLRAHGVEAVLPMLPTEAVDFVHAHAA